MNLLWISLFLLAADWTDWRGPQRDGTSADTGLITRWSRSGENLLWRVPYSGRSTPIVFGKRVFLQNSVGAGETLQERVICFDADTGKPLWEHRFNVYLSDVPPHRVGWASPVVDRTSGNIFVFGVGGTLLSLSPEGKLLWERSLGEEFGLVTTHGGRTVSPIIEGDTVIVSGITAGWGEQAAGSHRFMAFDKATGQTAWVSTPGKRPYDTTYSPPIAANINGARLLIAGAGDGAVHALKAYTGEPVWRFEMSKRGINTGVVLRGTQAVVSHSEENLNTSEMGLIAALDAGSRGELGKQHVQWSLAGFQGGYSSPVIDGDRVYQVDNGSNLYAFRLDSGEKLWTLNLGTIQKASPVLADGRLYVGTENGKFFILKPGERACEILDEDLLGTEQNPEAIVASVAISGGRIYLVSNAALYCIGSKGPLPASRPIGVAGGPIRGISQPRHVQVFPTELILSPGATQRFRARLFDASGNSLREASEAQWTVEGLDGTIDGNGELVLSSTSGARAGTVKATVQGVTGQSRIRVIPPLPWNEDFESLQQGSVPPQWINARGKFVAREIEGNKVFVKLADNPFTKRARVYMGPPEWSNYTVQGDVLATEKRRQMGDAGVVAQRYALLLFGNHQRMELQPWQPETTRTVTVPFSWKPGTWYRLKLRVENSNDGKTRMRGKAWPAAEAEPAEWVIDRVDPIANRKGSPGIYADAPAEIYFDNLKVITNE